MRQTNRRGLALPMALATLLLLGILAATMAFAGQQRMRLAVNLSSAARSVATLNTALAMAATHAALLRADSIPIGGTLTLTEFQSAPNARGRVIVMRITERLFRAYAAGSIALGNGRVIERGGVLLLEAVTAGECTSDDDATGGSAVVCGESAPGEAAAPPSAVDAEAGESVHGEGVVSFRPVAVRAVAILRSH